MPDKAKWVNEWKQKEQNDQLSDFAESLSGYAVEIRYPGDFFECSIEEAEEAVEMAKAFKNFVLRKLNN